MILFFEVIFSTSAYNKLALLLNKDYSVSQM